MRNFDVNISKEKIESSDWNDYFEERNPDVLWDIYYSIILDIADNMCPF